MRLEDLDYQLPPELIAQRPAPIREEARLLIVDRAHGHLHDSWIRDLPNWLRPGDSLVLNETRVRPARLVMRRQPTGGKVELLIIRRDGDGGETWRALARPARHARVGARLEEADGDLALEVVDGGEDGERVVRVAGGDLEATLARAGSLPLPPYIHRPAGPEDRDRYQTVYARVEGAVAAPTAGLHFSHDLLDRVVAGGIDLVRVLLHVGPGTFRPITSADPTAHRMDAEYFEVSDVAAEALRRARSSGGRIIPVGTTSVRALESACDLHGGRLAAASGWTRKFVAPPYTFQAADALMTNFHLPRTTLLLLVAAFAGESLVRRAYQHAVAKGYRFYSYGDAMLVV